MRQLGQGGVGVVYEAEQRSPHRRVAIKLLHPMQVTATRTRRFQQEAALLGRLQHPGIAQIFEASTYDLGRGPQPFFAMELVEGVDIRTHCDRAALDRAARIELLIRVADAVHYAHEHGVVHRDLKPDNVLVNQRGRPRILDFGIARATDSTPSLATALTEPGQLVGTLAYMAPEQLSQTEAAVTPQVDVYAVGVLAFELLTGRLPRTVEDLPVSKAIALLAGADPPRAGQIDPSLKGDLETILGKALEADPVRRYASSAALAGDLRRHLAHQPIEARPPSRIYLLRKFTQRHRGLVGGVTGTLAVAIAGAIVAAGYAINADRRADELERASYVAGIAAANSAVQQQDYATAAARLDLVPAIHRGWEYDHLRARLVHHSDEWDAPPGAFASRPAFDREGGRMFVMLKDGSLGTWDSTNGRLLRVTAIDALRDRNTAGGVLLHGPSLRFATIAEGGDLVIGSLESAEQTRVDLHGGRVLDWDAAGRLLLYSSAGMRIWDGEQSRILTERQSGRGAINHAGDRVALAFAGGLALFDALSGDLLCECKLDDQVVDLAFAPDDATLAAAGYYRNAYLLDGSTLGTVTRLVGHQDAVHTVTWTADGARLVTTSKDGTLRIWNVDGRGVPAVLYTGEPGVDAIAAAITPDGEHVVVAGTRPRRFPLGEQSVLRGHRSYVYYLTFSPDGSRLASSGYRDPDIHVWDVNRSTLLRRFPAPSTRTGAVAPIVAFSEDGRRLVGTSSVETVHWGLETGDPLPVPANPDLTAQFFETLGRRVWGAAGSPAISRDGSRLAVCEPLGTVQLFARSPSDVIQLPPQPAVFAQDRLVSSKAFGTPIGRLTGHVGTVYCAAFSPDGTRIATGGNDGTVRIWDAITCEELLALRGHEQYVSFVVFSPDGTLLASASGDATIRLWDTLPLHERRALGGK